MQCVNSLVVTHVDRRYSGGQYDAGWLQVLVERCPYELFAKAVTQQVAFGAAIPHRTDHFGPVDLLARKAKQRRKRPLRRWNVEPLRLDIRRAIRPQGLSGNKKWPLC